MNYIYGETKIIVFTTEMYTAIATATDINLLYNVKRKFEDIFVKYVNFQLSTKLLQNSHLTAKGG